MPRPRRLAVIAERWPISGAFVIARGAKTEAQVVVAEISEGERIGRGEAVPYGRYGETLEGVLAQLEGARSAVEGGVDRAALQALLPPGAARNALDCALWDLEAKTAQGGDLVWVKDAADFYFRVNAHA